MPVLTLLTELASGSDTISGDLTTFTDFTNNVIEQTEKLGISIEF